MDKKWDDVAMARGRLKELKYLDNMGFVVRWELAENYLLKMWKMNESFVVRKGATLSPEQLRYVKLCAMDK